MTPFPILLYKLPSDKPFLQLTLIKDTRYETINFIRYLGLQIQALDIWCVRTTIAIQTSRLVFPFISVDQPFLVRLLSWVDGATKYLMTVDGTNPRCMLTLI